MATREADHLLRKKLQLFMKELHQVGTLRGFKHFSLYIRGKEELIVSVANEPKSCGPSHVNDGRHARSPGINPSSPMIFPNDDKKVPLPQPSASFTSGDLPYDKSALMLSQGTQMKLSGYGDEGVGLPPASPSEQENANDDSNSTLFLLACYSRYGCPYVWVRSNHERLVKLTRDMHSKDKDNPLRLKSTMNWRKQDLGICDILVEVVKLCTFPAPQNPLAIDFTYLSELSALERLMTTGALLQTLEKVVLSARDDKVYVAHVLEDYQKLTCEHMKTLNHLLNTGYILSPAHNVQSRFVAGR